MGVADMRSNISFGDGMWQHRRRKLGHRSESGAISTIAVQHLKDENTLCGFWLENFCVKRKGCFQINRTAANRS
jgi:hypothetical protein